MHSTSLAALLIVMTTTGTAIASTPSTPNNFHLIEYSSSTAELFWEPSFDVDGIRGYELLSNGNSLWLGDVASYLDSNLPTDRNRVYEIIAVDSYGNRSVPSSVLTLSGHTEGTTNSSQSSCSNTSTTGFSSCTSTSSSQAGDGTQLEPSVNTSPSTTTNYSESDAIENLHAEVYSDTALELFWERASDESQNYEYHVYRNDQLVGITQGISYFDKMLNPGTTYLYEVRHLKDGIRTAAQSIGVKTRGTSSSSSSSSSRSDGTHTSRVYGETYSRHAVEIFWETSASVSHFDVYRNGSHLGNFNALSYLDDGLIADTEYRYEVYASGEYDFLLGDVGLHTSK